MLLVNRLLSVAFLVIGVALLIETALLRRRALRPPRPRG
jgi:hypothetical protein